MVGHETTLVRWCTLPIRGVLRPLDLNASRYYGVTSFSAFHLENRFDTCICAVHFRMASYLLMIIS